MAALVSIDSLKLDSTPHRLDWFLAFGQDLLLCGGSWKWRKEEKEEEEQEEQEEQEEEEQEEEEEEEEE